MNRNSPLPWLQDEQQASVLHQTLQAARDDHPSAAELERLTQAVVRQWVGPGGPSGPGGPGASNPVPGGPAAPSGSPASGGASLLMKLGLAALVGGGVGLWLISSEPDAPRETAEQRSVPHASGLSRAPAPVAPKPVLPKQQAPAVTLSGARSLPAISTRSALPVTRPRRTASMRPAPPVFEVDPNAEAQLLARARAALASDPNASLELTREHRRVFGPGTFGEEREALAIEALDRAGDGSGAARRFEQFERHYPHSLHRARLRARGIGQTPSTPPATR